MKCGTTSLHRYLAGHPQIFVSEPKELRFFSGENWDRGTGWYESNFTGVTDEVAVGEASPTYSQATVYPGVPGRVAAYLPEVRLVYVVRHPIDRIRSMYLHRFGRGIEQRPIAEAVTEDSSYVATSCYAFQVEQYLDHFERDRLLVITAENLLDDRERTFARVLEFLGADSGFRPVDLDREVHRTSGKRVSTAWGQRVESTLGRALVGRLPRRVQREVRRLTSKPLDPGVADLPVAIETELRSRFRADVARLREFAGSAVDAWDLA